MAGTSSRTKPVSIRIPIELLAVCDGYAARHKVSRAAAILHFIKAGIDTTDNAPKPLTRDDVAAMEARIEARMNARFDSAEESAKARHEASQEGRKAELAAIVSAIEKQPVVVQESPALPDPDAWKSKGIFDRLLKR